MNDGGLMLSASVSELIPNLFFYHNLPRSRLSLCVKFLWLFLIFIQLFCFSLIVQPAVPTRSLMKAVPLVIFSLQVVCL